MSEFHLLRPLWLLSLPALAVLVYLLTRAHHRSGNWARVCDAALLPYLLKGGQASRRANRSPAWIGILGSLLIFALAGPTWERLPQPVFRDQSALVIALDLSRSMDAADLTPSRLTRARLKITDILRQRQGGQTALLVYAASAFTVTPLSDDVDTLLAQLPALETSLMPRQGSRSDRALETALALLQQAGAPRGQVLLITDGIDGPGMAEPIDRLREQGHRLSILGVGTTEGAPIPLADGGFLKDSRGTIVVPRLDIESLQQWATRGGGRFTTIDTGDRDIRYLLTGSQQQALDQSEQAAGFTSDQWQEFGPWLVLLVLPFAALAFRRGVLVIAVLLLAPIPDTAQALEWVDLWQTPDQQGASALASGDADSAARRFEDPQWKAAAQYRAGQYQAAAETLAGIEDADALYNRGNALARLGQLPEASASYEQALALDPQHEDAKHNLELLRQQQQQSEQQGDQEQQDAETDQDGQSSQDSAGQRGDSSDEPTQHDQGQHQGRQDTGEQRDTAGAQDPGEQEGDAQDQQRATGNAQENQDRDEESTASGMKAESSDSLPENPATEQWLRRIPDDPGGLLRRKFLYQYQQRDTRHEQEDQPW